MGVEPDKSGAQQIPSANAEASPGSTSALPIIKRPPPESDQSQRTRKLVILSFWAVVIFLGLPVWWWTTSIHRARLPLQDMLEWADGKVQ